MGSSLAQISYFTKERYGPQRIEELTLKGRPLLALISKDTEFVGDPEPVPVTYAAGQGISNEYSTAKANQSNIAGVRFEITVGEIFGAVTIDDKALLTARNNIGAFLKVKMAETDALWNSVSNKVHTDLWSNGGQSLGQVSSGYSSGNTITLENTDTIVNFEKGMVLTASANDGSSSGHSVRSGTMTITAVDRTDGQITVDDATGITGLAGSDYLFLEGTIGKANYRKAIAGMQAWLPASDPSSTSFFNVDRSVDVQRLGGIRIPTAETKGNILERWRLLAERISTRGEGDPTHGFTDPATWRKTATALEGQRVRSETTKVGHVGFASLRVESGSGDFEIFSDRRAPVKEGFLLDMSTWKLKSMKGVPHVRNEDGLVWLRSTTSNGYVYELKAYPQLCSNAPGRNGRITLTS